MRLTIVVFALAVALAWGKPHRVENSKNILAEINKNAFGNTVLSMVHLATATGDGVDQINLLLQNIAAQLNQQQATADKVHENDSATCEKLINDFESAINYHETQIVAVTKLRDDTTEALAEAETEVRQATKDLEQNGDTYASESALRVQQHSTWEEKDAEADANIVAIDEASKIVQHLQAGVAFSQLKSRFDKVTARLTETKHALFKPLISALTQLATKVDNKQIVKILDLLSQIRQQVVAAKNNLRETEERQATNWAAQSAHLQEESKRLTDRKAFLEGAIVSYKAVIEGANLSLEDHTLALEDEQEALAIQERWCETQETEYEEQNVQREEQAEAIERIQDLLINKGGAVSDFLDEREDEEF